MNITSFLAPLFPENQLRAVYLPEISTIFIAKNPKTESGLFKNLKNIKKTNATKFFNTEILKSHRNLLTLYEKVSDELLKKATQNLSSALKNHDKIEEMYISAMDYKKINKTADKLISAILPKN